MNEPHVGFIESWLKPKMTNVGEVRVCFCRRLVRFVYYLLELLLGSGSAGTPSTSPGLPVSSMHH